VDIWDTGEEAPLCTLSSYQGTVRAVATGEIDGHAIVVFGGKHSKRIDSPDPHSEERGRVFVYDLTGGSFLHILEGHEGEVQSVAMGMMSGQCIIVSGGDDAMVCIWNFADGAELATIDIGASITSLALVASTLVVGSVKGVLCVNLAATQYAAPTTCY
jgi:WD40 repeat protein